tara:strand:- start:828 stop:1427 length:600 start_codon:yes stop_codon:yes gene_type:complete
MTNIKHVGRLTTNKRKVVVAYRVIPNDPDHCLVVHTESLDADQHDSLMKLLDSTTGQEENELATAMGRTRLPDGRIMLAAFHTQGKLNKVPTNLVEMTPNMQSTINLAELNQIIAKQKGVTVADLAISNGAAKPAATTSSMAAMDEVVTTTDNILDDATLAKNLRSQADAMFKEAQRLRSEAEELAPTAKKSKATASVK